jgi:hypothetical protein
MFPNSQLFTIESRQIVAGGQPWSTMVNPDLCRYVFLSKCRSSQVASSRKKADRFVLQKVSMLFHAERLIV